MHSAYIDAVGETSAIRYGELPDPSPGRGQVLVQVEAVSANSVDTFVRSGAWRTELSFPVALGRDLVGTVAALGPGVSDLVVGQAVWANSAGFGGRAGATSELVPVDRDRLYTLPAGADPVRFVAAVHPGTTAHGGLYGRARLRPREIVAVVGANGAVGMCLVQAAVLRGADVVAVVRHEEPVERLQDLGADRVVVADAEAAAAAITDAAPTGVDVVVDTSGFVDLATIPAVLRPRGRILVLAGRGTTNLDLWQVETRELQLVGFVVSELTPAELAAAAQWINSTHPDHPLTVDVGAVLGFDQAAVAHELIETGRLPRTATGTVGRLVLRP